MLTVLLMPNLSAAALSEAPVGAVEPGQESEVRARQRPSPPLETVESESDFQSPGSQRSPDTASTKPDSTALPEPSESTRRWEFVGAPIPIIDPTVGNGLAGAGGFLVHLNPRDKVSPPSIFGAGAAYTSNGTWAYGILSELFLREDRFRITGIFGQGQVNYDYYGKGILSEKLDLYAPLSIDGLFFLVEPKVRVFERWYVGPRYHLIKARVGLDWDQVHTEFPWIPDLGLGEELSRLGVDVRSAALGLRVERDSRDSQFYPRKGAFVDMKLDFFNSAFGSTQDYRTVSLSGSGFVGFKEKNVIAWRASACSASEATPFFDLCMLGSAQDMRGYAIGKYQDHFMLVGQMEYRRELFWRFGAVAYVGAGEVARSISDLNTGAVLPGGGIGGRFTLSEESRVNFRVDYAWGKDSSALYLGIMEAF